MCVCVWDLTWIRSKDCCVPMLPCIINHLQRRIDSLLLQSWRSRACSHTAVSHTQWLSPIFSLLYYYSWYSGPNEVTENEERKKIQLPVAKHTNTLAQVQLYKCEASGHQRFFHTLRKRCCITGTWWVINLSRFLSVHPSVLSDCCLLMRVK